MQDVSLTRHVVEDKLMILFDDKVKVCDRCYWTTCFELPMATGIMFSMNMLTNFYCNDSKQCVFPISFCHRHNSSNPLVICQGLSEQILTQIRKLW